MIYILLNWADTYGVFARMYNSSKHYSEPMADEPVCLLTVQLSKVKCKVDRGHQLPSFLVTGKAGDRLLMSGDLLLMTTVGCYWYLVRGEFWPKLSTTEKCPQTPFLPMANRWWTQHNSPKNFFTLDQNLLPPLKRHVPITSTTIQGSNSEE